MRTLVQLQLIAWAAVAAQAQPTQAPAFEVASIKRMQPEMEAREPIGLFTYPGGRIKATNYTLRMLIHDAFNVDLKRIIGGSAWIDTERYVVECRPPESSPASRWAPENFKTPPTAEMRTMLQTLLAERFGLRTHWEQKATRVFALVAMEKGVKLRAPANSAAEPFVGIGRSGSDEHDAVSQTIIGENATMDQLAKRLSRHLGRPVENRTGLADHYDFTIEFAANESQADAAPGLDRAILEQLGIKLAAEPGTMEVLVIDHAKRPGAN